jgi:CTP:phosphocholine cytidylyltransferase-like protein
VPTNNFILLAAGKGSRLEILTRLTPKPLLPVCGLPAIQNIIEPLIKLENPDIVVVTGYREKEVKQFIRNTYGNSIKLVFNEKYEVDTNILSVNLGVEALDNPKCGYSIIETDIILEPNGWKEFLSFRKSSFSAWATMGAYSKNLTGGAVEVSPDGEVKNIVYAPKYDKRFEGWKKMLGFLKVGINEVELDRELRQKAIKNRIDQYYLNPWLENLNLLPCGEIDLSGFFAGAFNDLDSYNKLNNDYNKFVLDQ